LSLIRSTRLERKGKMAEIRSGNIEVYIRQLISEVLDDLEQRSIDDKLLKDASIRLSNRALMEKSK